MAQRIHTGTQTKQTHLPNLGLELCDARVHGRVLVGGAGAKLLHLLLEGSELTLQVRCPRGLGLGLGCFVPRMLECGFELLRARRGLLGHVLRFAGASLLRCERLELLRLGRNLLPKHGNLPVEVQHCAVVDVSLVLERAYPADKDGRKGGRVQSAHALLLFPTKQPTAFLASNALNSQGTWIIQNTRVWLPETMGQSTGTPHTRTHDPIRNGHRQLTTVPEQQLVIVLHAGILHLQAQLLDQPAHGIVLGLYSYVRATIDSMHEG